MKIVHLTPLYYPHVGGIEKHLLLLNRELTRQGHAVTVITQLHEPGLSVLETHQDTKIIRITGFNFRTTRFEKIVYKLQIWKEIWKLRKVIAAADVVQIHDVFWWLLVILPFLDRKRIYITFHGYEGNDPPNARQIFWHQVAAWYTRANLCVGDFHAKWYKLQPSIVTYGAVEKTEETTEITHPKRAQSESNRPTIIYIGRLSEDSGIEAYLESLLQLKQKKIEVQLDIYGTGPKITEYKKFCAKHDLPVHFFGAVENASQHLSKYDIAFVSRYLAILEALAANIPIIAQYNNEIKFDYLALAPFAKDIAIVQKPSEIAAQVELLIQVPDNKPSRSTQKWVQAQTWKNMATIYQQLWQL